MENKVQSPALIMRSMKYEFVVSGILFVYIGFKVMAPPRHEASQPIQIAFASVGLVCIAGGFLVPGLLFRPVQGAAQNVPVTTQLQRWMVKSIMSLAYFEASILFGLVLHMLGGSNRIVGLLMGAGIAAELIWSPGPPPGAQSGEFPQG